MSTLTPDPASIDPFEHRVGTILRGKWKLVRLLGVGGMASVYVAEHVSIGQQKNAIKILHPEIARHEEARARFEQEAHAVNHLAHPAAVRVFDLDHTDEGLPFIVMELLDGESLDVRLERDGKLAPGEVLGIVDRLLDVIVAAHARQIIHRDIKPDNLFLAKDGTLKVLDFGIARLRDAPGVQIRTRTGATMGTPSYMAPEQMKGVDVDHRVDIFAIGATMFELISGRRIHQAQNEQQLAFKVLTEPAPPLASVAPDAPAGICQVVDRALAYEAADRYPDAARMHADVRALLAGQPPPYAAGVAPFAGAVAPTRIDAPALTPPPATVAAAPAVAAEDNRRGALLVAVGAAALLALAVIVWIATAGEADESTGAVSREETTSDQPANVATEGAPPLGTATAPPPVTRPVTTAPRPTDHKAEEKAREARRKAEEKEREARKKHEERGRGHGKGR